MTFAAAPQIDLLGTRYEVLTDDERHTWMFRRLWAPFARSNQVTGAVPLRFEGWGSEATFRLANNDPVNTPAPWRLAIESRNALVLDALDRASALVDLHAALVVREGFGILLVGPMSSGKTTFALELIARGFQLVSDDMAPIDPASGEIIPLPKPLIIKTRSWRDMRPLWEPVPEWLPEPEGLFVVPASSLPLSARVEQVGAIAFLSWVQDAEVRIERLTPAEAIARSGTHIRHPTPRALVLLSNLCRRAVTISVTYSSADAAVDPLLASLKPPLFVSSR